MIDPVEAVVSYLRLHLGPYCGNQVVAGRSRYGESWPLSSVGVTVMPASGAAARLDGVRSPNVVVQTWGPTERDTYQMNERLVEVLRDTRRKMVRLADGRIALIHYVARLTEPALLWDDQVRAWTIMQACRTLVGGPV